MNALEETIARAAFMIQPWWLVKKLIRRIKRIVANIIGVHYQQIHTNKKKTKEL